MDIVDDVLQLGRRVRQNQRHGDASRPPNAPLDGNVVKPRWYQERYASSPEMRAAVEQRGGHVGRRIEQRGVREGFPANVERDTIPV